MPVRLRNQGAAKDIFCLTKLRMSDDGLCQDPLLVLPHALCASTSHFWSTVTDPSSTLPTVHPSIDQERREELDTLSKELVQDFPHFQRARDYYKKLVGQSWDKAPPRRFKFLSAGPTADERIGDISLGEAAPRPKPHKLKVVFHRCQDQG